MAGLDYATWLMAAVLDSNMCHLLLEEEAEFEVACCQHDLLSAALSILNTRAFSNVKLL